MNKLIDIIIKDAYWLINYQQPVMHLNENEFKSLVEHLIYINNNNFVYVIVDKEEYIFIRFNKQYLIKKEIFDKYIRYDPSSYMIIYYYQVNHKMIVFNAANLYNLRIYISIYDLNAFIKVDSTYCYFNEYSDTFQQQTINSLYKYFLNKNIQIDKNDIDIFLNQCMAKIFFHERFLK